MVHNSKELVESILTGDMVSAKKLFESRLESIKENKLYEEKRRIAAINESTYSPKTQEKLDAGYRKASDVLGDPTASTSSETEPKSDMSRQARRAQLDKKRRDAIEKYRSSQPLRSLRLMKKGEIATRLLAKGAGSVVGTLSDIGKQLEP